MYLKGFETLFFLLRKFPKSIVWSALGAVNLEVLSSTILAGRKKDLPNTRLQILGQNYFIFLIPNSTPYIPQSCKQ